MILLKTVQELTEWRRELNGSVGFVPTMGALHDGHESLLIRARSENKYVVLSIFVNPTQFNDPKDLETYPMDIRTDLDIAEKLQVDAVFIPVASEMYPAGFRYSLIEKKDSEILCGKFRRGFYEGILTVVLKLFNLVQPHRAYFGEKDFLQMRLVEGMVNEFFLPIEIVACPTIRAPDGLAMSSRNRRLSAEAREKAPLIQKVLMEASTFDGAKAFLEPYGFKLEYFEEHFGRRFIAAWLEGTRLIDNVSIPQRK